MNAESTPQQQAQALQADQFGQAHQHTGGDGENSEKIEVGSHAQALAKVTETLR